MLWSLTSSLKMVFFFSATMHEMEYVISPALVIAIGQVDVQGVCAVDTFVGRFDDLALMLCWVKVIAGCFMKLECLIIQKGRFRRCRGLIRKFRDVPQQERLQETEVILIDGTALIHIGSCFHHGVGKAVRHTTLGKTQIKYGYAPISVHIPLIGILPAPAPSMTVPAGAPMASST